MRQVYRGELNPLNGGRRERFGGGGWHFSSRCCGRAIKFRHLETLLTPPPCRPLSLLKCRKVLLRKREELDRGRGGKDNNERGFYDLCNYRLQREEDGRWGRRPGEPLPKSLREPPEARKFFSRPRPPLFFWTYIRLRLGGMRDRRRFKMCNFYGRSGWRRIHE